MFGTESTYFRVPGYGIAEIVVNGTDSQDSEAGADSTDSLVF
jgi:hypothetical protein